MKRIFAMSGALLLVALAVSTDAIAEPTIEKFAIEGLISPASPKALISELEEQTKAKVVDLNLKNTESGWPVLSIRFDSSQLSREDIERAIATIEDPAGHKYRVHSGPPMSNAAYTGEDYFKGSEFIKEHS